MCVCVLCVRVELHSVLRGSFDDSVKSVCVWVCFGVWCVFVHGAPVNFTVARPFTCISTHISCGFSWSKALSSFWRYVKILFTSLQAFPWFHIVALFSTLLAYVCMYARRALIKPKINVFQNKLFMNKISIFFKATGAFFYSSQFNISHTF